LSLALNLASYFSRPSASSPQCCAVSSKILLLAGSLVFVAKSAHSDALVRYSADFAGIRRCPIPPHPIQSLLIVVGNRGNIEHGGRALMNSV
jgi:hypothetical protein